jgi:hypothetical protein
LLAQLKGIVYPGVDRLLPLVEFFRVGLFEQLENVILELLVRVCHGSQCSSSLGSRNRTKLPTYLGIQQRKSRK